MFIPANGAGTRTVVLAEAGKSYGSPELSPDGKQLAFMVSPSEGINFGQIGLATLNGTTASDIQLVTFDRAASNLTWAELPTTGKGKKSATTYAVYFSASSNGGVPLYRLNPATRDIVQLTTYDSGITAFDVVGNQIVFAKTEVINPSELYVTDITAKNQTKLS
ncbi:TolB family protein, partial [Pseudoxanthomonas gei]|uniref:TolB family protein n=1 Tax=Pseudoxanthomonas gei TaxID=1383030 RepID=UPI001B88473C